MIDKIILWVSLVVSIFGYTFWSPIKEIYGIDGIYYYCVSFSVVCFTFVLCRKYRSIVTEAILSATTNNLVDELIFNPTKFQWNEYIIYGASLLIIIYNARKRKISQRKARETRRES